MQSIELKEISATLKEIRSNLENYHQDDLDENSVSISVFKICIIMALAIAFFVLSIAVAISIFDVFSEFSALCVLISSAFATALVSMIALVVLSDIERKKPKNKRIIKRLSVICSITICVYIAMSTTIMLVSDILLQDEKLTTCSILNTLFGGLGFTISLMIQEVWRTKDKTFIFAFIALVWALVVGIIT